MYRFSQRLLAGGLVVVIISTGVAAADDLSLNGRLLEQELQEFQESTAGRVRTQPVSRRPDAVVAVIVVLCVGYYAISRWNARAASQRIYFEPPIRRTEY